jgi:hypothetical protein
MPFVKLDPTPSKEDPVIDVFVDEELGGEGFTYRLASETEGSVPLDAVLEYHEDPAYLADLALYRLTLEAKEHFDASGLSVREVAALLKTSPAQLYRLLDTTNYSKSIRQLISLLYVLGCDVDVRVTERSPRAS